MLDRLDWSPAEKKIARRVFDVAVEQELRDAVSEFKARALAVETTDDMWDLEPYLAQRRRGIDQKYEYRYSQLIWVFQRLVAEGRVRIEDLEGLAEEKIKMIRGVRDAW